MKERAHMAKMPGAHESHSAALGVALPLTTWDLVNLMLLGILRLPWRVSGQSH